MKKIYIVFILLSLFEVSMLHAQPRIDKLLFGVAYYDEYMPYDRLDKDIAMMKTAGINIVRIAESTWSTLEPQWWSARWLPKFESVPKSWTVSAWTAPRCSKAS